MAPSSLARPHITMFGRAKEAGAVEALGPELRRDQLAAALDRHLPDADLGVQGSGQVAHGADFAAVDAADDVARTQADALGRAADHRRDDDAAAAERIDAKPV